MGNQIIFPNESIHRMASEDFEAYQAEEVKSKNMLVFVNSSLKITAITPYIYELFNYPDAFSIVGQGVEVLFPDVQEHSGENTNEMILRLGRRLLMYPGKCTEELCNQKRALKPSRHVIQFITFDQHLFYSFVDIITFTVDEYHVFECKIIPFADSPHLAIWNSKTICGLDPSYYYEDVFDTKKRLFELGGKIKKVRAENAELEEEVERIEKEIQEQYNALGIPEIDKKCEEMELTNIVIKKDIESKKQQIAEVERKIEERKVMDPSRVGSDLLEQMELAAKKQKVRLREAKKSSKALQIMRKIENIEYKLQIAAEDRERLKKEIEALREEIESKERMARGEIPVPPIDRIKMSYSYRLHLQEVEKLKAEIKNLREQIQAIEKSLRKRDRKKTQEELELAEKATEIKILSSRNSLLGNVISDIKNSLELLDTVIKNDWNALEILEGLDEYLANKPKPKSVVESVYQPPNFDGISDSEKNKRKRFRRSTISSGRKAKEQAALPRRSSGKHLAPGDSMYDTGLLNVGTVTLEDVFDDAHEDLAGVSPYFCEFLSDQFSVNISVFYYYYKDFREIYEQSPDEMWTKMYNYFIAKKSFFQIDEFMPEGERRKLRMFKFHREYFKVLDKARDRMEETVSSNIWRDFSDSYIFRIYLRDLKAGRIPTDGYSRHRGFILTYNRSAGEILNEDPSLEVAKSDLDGPSLSKELMDILLSLFRNFYMATLGVVDLTAIKMSKPFNKFIVMARKLQGVDLGELELRDDGQKKAFFVNIHNVMLLHYLIENMRMLNTKNLRSIFQDIRYTIGGRVFSLSQVKEKCLRLGQEHLSVKKIQRRSRRDPKVVPDPLCVREFDPRVHMALIRLESQTDEISVLDPSGDVDEQLDRAARKHVQKHCKVDYDAKEIILSSLISENQADFGWSASHIILFLRQYIDVSDPLPLYTFNLRRTKSESSLTIEFSEGEF